MKAAIVIHIYKNKLNDFELASVLNVQNKLKSYPVYFVCPKLFDITWYKANLSIEEKTVKRFTNSYFKSLQGYNRLMKSLKFYKAFSHYDYILIHHADAWVFRDELEHWCNKGYDYIGAPVYKYNGTISPPETDYICVGNGGFSLHKVASAIKVLKSFKYIYPKKDLIEWYRQYNIKGKVRYFPYLLRMLFGFGGNSHHICNYFRLNEDIFWGKYVSDAFPGYKVAPFEEAYKFSMEYNCENLFELNNRQLPFGCHQWYKTGFFDFWRNHERKQEY